MAKLMILTDGMEKYQKNLNNPHGSDSHDGVVNH